MRLQRLDLLRYGHFTDRSFELPAGNIDIHIVFGPNESGKSTALSAIEDLLFGVLTKSPYNFLHDYPSMRIGAILENGRESLKVIRRKGSKDTLLITDNSPFPGGEAALRPFLAGADRSFFKRMFSLDHVRLETGGREILEAKDEIGKMLFSAGTGIAGLRDRLTALSNEADKLWAPRRAEYRKYYQSHEKLKEAEKQRDQQTFATNKWQELKKSLETAENAHAETEGKFEKALAKHKQLGRIRRVYKDIRRKTELEKDIAELGAVIRLPGDALQVVNESERKEFEAVIKISTFSKQLANAREGIKALTYDEHLVFRTEDVTKLHERRIKILGEKADLPKRQADLNAAEADLRDLATDLGWHDEEVGDLIERIPVRVKLNEARLLLNRRGELASNVETKTKTLEENEAERDELQSRLDAMRETKDVSRLEAVIKAVRESGDVTGRVRRADQQVKNAQERVNRLLSSLHPSLPSENDVIEIHPPTRVRVQDHRDRVQDWDRRFRETIYECSRVEQKLTQDRESLQNATWDNQVVTIGKLQVSRGDRDALWRLVKQKHIEKAPISDEETHRYADALNDLAAAFESAMRIADGLADQRFDNAEAVGRLAEMSRNIEDQQDSLARLQKKQKVLTQEGERLNADWKILWDKAPLEPLTPDAMLEWLERRDQLLKAIERRVEEESELETQRREEREAKAYLLKELSSLGADRTALENDTLPVILERADRVWREYEKEAGDKASLEQSLQETSTKIERQHRELARAKQKWSKWQEEWSAALAKLGLATDSNPDAVSTQIDVIDQMREKAKEIKNLRRQRIDKIKQDIANFESDVETMVLELAEDLAGTAADDAVLEIKKRLDRDQRIRERRDSKMREIEKMENEVHALEDARQEARDSVSYLNNMARSNTSDELKSAIEKSDSLRALQGELETTRQTLAREGDGLTVAELEAECDAVDIDQIPAREETINRELETLRDQYADAVEKRSQSRNAFEAVGGDDAAARAEATRQEALAEIREVSEQYVRVRTSAMLLQWAIDRYRREKQAPLLQRAGELFAMLTGDSFKRLQVDYDETDQAHLTGVRPDGTVVHVSGMSSGTADQLYLALRVASIEDYLDRADALPFVADDLFINFDNDRAGAGFAVLGELSRKTQVIFFTHHSHLLDIARKILGDSISVVNLNGEQVDMTN